MTRSRRKFVGAVVVRGRLIARPEPLGLADLDDPVDAVIACGRQAGRARSWSAAWVDGATGATKPDLAEGAPGITDWHPPRAAPAVLDEPHGHVDRLVLHDLAAR